MRVYCLASGSSGNALLAVAPEGGALLVDAGLGMRTLKRYAEERGIAPEALAGILVTHEHTDHAAGAIPFAVRYKVPLVATEGTLTALIAQDGREPPHRILPPGEETSLGPFGIRAVATSHDALEPCGFRVEADGAALVYATDTGAVTPALRAACPGAQLLVIEANHDIDRLRFGPYPEVLKRRILAHTGHLSNDDAVGLVLEHTGEHGPASVWFAHLSEVNNTPGMVRGYWKRRWQAEGLRASPAAVEIAGRDTPSLQWHSGLRAVQRALF